jgi:O-antigen ligase
VTLLRQLPRWVLVGGFSLAAAALNLLLGFGAAYGHKAVLVAFVIAILPALVIGFGALVESQRTLLIWAALAISFTGLGALTDPLPVPGGTKIFTTDLLLLLAFGAAFAARLSGVEPTGRSRLSVIFRWPLALLAVAVLAGVLKGHERYGANIIAQPFRLVLYAAIALAVLDTTPESAWKAITRVFYAGALIASVYAVHDLAAGTSHTGSSNLSTGGVRVLALSSAIYLTGSMICALLNLELERQPLRQVAHAAIAGLALFGVIVSFGRTTYAAVALIVPLLLASRRYMRRTVLQILPLFAPALVVVALLIPTFAPDLPQTLQRRVTGTSSQDISVQWRARARDAALEGIDQEWLTGVGFGRITHFELAGQTITIFGDPHNSYVYLLAGGGVLALGSFLLVCVLYLVDALRRLRRADGVEQALIIWALGTWLTFMINALAGPILSNPIMLLTIWILFALPSVVPAREAGPST